MKSKWFNVALSVLVSLVVFAFCGLTSYNCGYVKGVAEGKEIGIAEQQVWYELKLRELRNNYFTVAEDEKVDEDIYGELIKQIVECANSIDVDISVNRDGYSKGVISIYFDSNLD